MHDCRAAGRITDSRFEINQIVIKKVHLILRFSGFSSCCFKPSLSHRASSDTNSSPSPVTSLPGAKALSDQASRLDGLSRRLKHQAHRQARQQNALPIPFKQSQYLVHQALTSAQQASYYAGKTAPWPQNYLELQQIKQLSAHYNLIKRAVVQMIVRL